MVERGVVLRKDKIDEVKRIFAALHCTKQEFADCLSISRATLDKFFKGEKPVDIDIFRLICQGEACQREEEKEENICQKGDNKKNTSSSKQKITIERAVEKGFLGLNINPEEYSGIHLHEVR